MQLTFDLETEPVLPRLRDSLLGVFGPQRPERGSDPLSQLVLSVISARTLDQVGGEAFLRLRAAFADWAMLATASPKRIEAAIAAVTFAENKARRLPVLIRMIQIKAGDLSLDFLAKLPVEEAMEWLTCLPGIGCKSAAVTLNFSRLNRRALVVDTHVHRVTKRLGLVGRASEPAQAYDALMDLLPPTWTAEDLFELYWLIKGLSQSICAEAAPRCGMCPLKTMCPRVGVGVGRKVVALDRDRRARTVQTAS